MKKIFSIFLVFIALTLGSTLVVASDEEGGFEAPDDGLSINYIKGHSERDLAVEFNHSSHEDYDCYDCHHKVQKAKKAEGPQSCAVCHDNFDVDNTKGYRSYFKAMHKIRQAPRTSRPSCVSCHTAEFGNDKDLTGCTRSGCHAQGLN